MVPRHFGATIGLDRAPETALIRIAAHNWAIAWLSSSAFKRRQQDQSAGCTL
jgi:hypothetical protein